MAAVTWRSNHLEGFLVLQGVAKAYFILGINPQKIEIALLKLSIKSALLFSNNQSSRWQRFTYRKLLNFEFLDVSRHPTNFHPHVTLGITHSHFVTLKWSSAIAFRSALLDHNGMWPQSNNLQGSSRLGRWTLK